MKARFLAKDFDTVETTGLGNFDGLFSFLLESSDSRPLSRFCGRIEPELELREMVPERTLGRVVLDLGR